MTDAIQPPTRYAISITAIPALGDNYIWLLSDGLKAVTGRLKIWKTGACIDFRPCLIFDAAID